MHGRRTGAEWRRDRQAAAVHNATLGCFSIVVIEKNNKLFNFNKWSVSNAKTVGLWFIQVVTISFGILKQMYKYCVCSKHSKHTISIKYERY